MNERDKELDQLLKPLINLQPAPGQMDRWKKLLRARPMPSKHFWARSIVQMTAAACIGFLIGAVFFKRPEVSQPQVAKNFDSFATIEYVDVKSM